MNGLKTGILLINLGTPRSPKPKDVYRYLIEFLTDPRVMDLPWFKRQLLVRGLIVPKRYRQSAICYQAIWTEEGSPLIVYGNRVKLALQDILGDDYVVELAMRYQEPSIGKGIEFLFTHPLEHLIILPLFPQYASATTGSVHAKVQEHLKRYTVIPRVTLMNQFASHPSLIKAFCEIAKKYEIPSYDHIVFSFHGLPERQLMQADKENHCLQRKECCQSWGKHNHSCYAAQCHATAQLIIEQLNISKERTSLCFQSRLGKEPWLQPYTSEVIHQLAKEGKKRVLVFCPAFVCDCLETLYEIGIEYQQEFVKAGGEKLDLVKGLNDHPAWIDALKTIVQEI